MKAFRSGRCHGAFALLEVIVVLVLAALALILITKIFSNSSLFSQKINDQQMAEHEAQRLLSTLRTDCRSARSIQASGEMAEIRRFGFDQANNVKESLVTYMFVDGNIVRQENGGSKKYEFRRWQKDQPALEGSFTLASPSFLWLRIALKNSDKYLIDERIAYENPSP